MMQSTFEIEKKDYKKAEMGRIPEGWILSKLGNLFEFKNGINAGKDAYGKGVKFVNVSTFGVQKWGDKSSVSCC